MIKEEIKTKWYFFFAKPQLNSVHTAKKHAHKNSDPLVLNTLFNSVIAPSSCKFNV